MKEEPVLKYSKLLSKWFIVDGNTLLPVSKIYHEDKLSENQEYRLKRIVDNRFSTGETEIES